MIETLRCLIIERIAVSTYEEGRALLIAHARGLLGHNRVQSICNAIVRQFFCRAESHYRPAPGLLFTLHHTCDQTTRWAPGAKPPMNVAGVGNQELLEL